MSNLDPQTARGIKVLCERGYELYDQENYKTALRVFYQAWLRVPKPQTDWLEAGLILTAIGDTYFRLNQYDQACEALGSALHCPSIDKSPFIHLRLGQSFLNQGNMSRARQTLYQAYTLGGKSVFEKESSRYLDAIKDIVFE